MIYMRGQAADYDGWRERATGWGWDDVLPLFKGQEDYSGRPTTRTAAAASGGSSARLRWDSLTVPRGRARRASRRPKTSIAATMTAWAYFQVNQRRGRRWSAVDGFLAPSKNRPDLRLVTGACRPGRLSRGEGATGIVFRSGTELVRAEARGEVILAGGAVGSPKLPEPLASAPARLLAGWDRTPP